MNANIEQEQLNFEAQNEQQSEQTQQAPKTRNRPKYKGETEKLNIKLEETFVALEAQVEENIKLKRIIERLVKYSLYQLIVWWAFNREAWKATASKATRTQCKEEA